MFVAFGIQHAMRMSHTPICCLSGSTTFFHIFEKNNTYWTQNVLFWLSLHLLSNNRLSQILRTRLKSAQSHHSIRSVTWPNCHMFRPQMDGADRRSHSDYGRRTLRQQREDGGNRILGILGNLCTKLYDVKEPSRVRSFGAGTVQHRRHRPSHRHKTITGAFWTLRI